MLNKSSFLATELMLLLIRADFTVLAPCASQRENCLLFSDVAYTTRSSVTPRGAQTGLHNYRMTHHNINKLYPAADSPTDTHMYCSRAPTQAGGRACGGCGRSKRLAQLPDDEVSGY